MPMIPARHEVFGEHLVPDTWLWLYPDDWKGYDPTEHDVDEVIAYLTDAGDDERQRVLAAEQASPRPRVTILRAFGVAEHPVAPQGLQSPEMALAAATQTPDAVGAGDTDTGTAPGTSTED